MYVRTAAVGCEVKERKEDGGLRVTRHASLLSVIYQLESYVLRLSSILQSHLDFLTLDGLAEKD